MRIISKFRDYYDSVQAYGADDRVVYKRETASHTVVANQWQFEKVGQIAREMPREDCYWVVAAHLLIFCGRAYPAWKCADSWSWTSVEIDAYLNRRRLRSDLESRCRPGVDALVDSSKSRRFSAPWMPKYRLTFRGIDSFVRDYFCHEVGPGIHLEYSSPVVLIRCRLGWSVAEHFEVVVNPCLKEMDFVRFVEPFTAYQEIAMYLGNELAQPDIAPQTVGSDKDLAKAKGFDDQSFRTAAPGQKKLNRRANRARKKAK